MYYEELIINGVLHWRSTPNGDWIPKSLEQLTAERACLKEINRELLNLLDGTYAIVKAKYSEIPEGRKYLDTLAKAIAEGRRYE